LEKKPKIPIIAQTAHALKEEKSKCFESGTLNYMVKPLNRKTTDTAQRSYALKALFYA